MKKRIAKKTKTAHDDMLSEYDFSNGVRGKYYKRFKEGVTITVQSDRKKQRRRSTLVVLEPDVALKFKNSKQVNSALRSVMAAKGR